MGNGNGFAAPDEAGAGAAKPAPAAECVFAGIAIGERVPAFHGLDGDAVREFEAGMLQGPLERRFGPDQQLEVTGNVQAERLQMTLECLDIF